MWLQFFVAARQSGTCATVAFLQSLSCRPTLKRHKRWRETMRRLILFLLPLALLPIFRMPASAQMSNMPEDLRARLAEIESDVGQGHPRQRGNDACALYASLSGGTEGRRSDRARSGLRTGRASSARPAQAGGPHRHAHRRVPAWWRLCPGQPEREHRSVWQCCPFFARQGMFSINGTYRLAPAAQWPAAAQGIVGLLVKSLKANASAHGGDPERISLIGHSAGATHIATYLYHSDLQEPNGAGIAGVVLMSGRYHFDPKPDDPNLTNFQAYFGTDLTRYPAQSPINYVKAAKPMPTFIVISEYDNPDLDTQGALLFGALCERDRACPRFTRMELHNHLSMVYQFNTADDAFWAAKSWNSSGAVGDLQFSPSWLKGICREAPWLALSSGRPQETRAFAVLSIDGHVRSSDRMTALRISSARF